MNIRIKEWKDGDRTRYVVDLRYIDGIKENLKKPHRFSSEDEAFAFVDKIRGGKYFEPGTSGRAAMAGGLALGEQAGSTIRWSYYQDIIRDLKQLCVLNYRDVGGKKIKFGEALCQNVMAIDIEEQIVPHLQALNYAENTILLKLKSLKKIFDYAARKKWCGDNNPVKKVVVPREKYKGVAEAEKTEIERYSVEEINRVVDFAMAKDKPSVSPTGEIICPEWCHGLALKFAAFTGLRFGEQAALKWKYVDLEKDTVRVQLAQRREPVGCSRDFGGNTEYLLDAPKNTKKHGKASAAIRNVFLTPELANDLREWRLRSPKSGDDDMVFITRGRNYRGTHPGHIVSANNWRRDYLTPACIAAGIKPITWHELRHFFATIAFEIYPENYVKVTELLGHADVQTTLNHYKGWFDKTGRMKEDGAAFQQILQR